MFQWLFLFSFAADVTLKFTVILEKYQKDGEDFVRVKLVKMNISPKNAKVNFTNLFNGDKTLGKVFYT